MNMAIAGDVEAAEEDKELLSYLDGTTEVPVRTYYTGASRLQPGSALQILADSSTEGLGPQQRLTYLGRAGVQTLAGLNVAFLDGSGSEVRLGSSSSKARAGSTADLLRSAG